MAGDLAVSVPTARRQAIGQGHSLSTEIKVLILHGLLHLDGCDHEADEGKMARREGRLRERLALPLGLIERARAPVQTKGKISEKPLSRTKARVDCKPTFRGLKAPAPFDKTAAARLKPRPFKARRDEVRGIPPLPQTQVLRLAADAQNDRAPRIAGASDTKRGRKL
jgi:hypothetical protein